MRGFCLAINNAARSTENHKIFAAVEARKELSRLLREIAVTEDTDETESLMDIVQLMAESDLLIAYGQPKFESSATATVEQMRDARTTLGLLREPETYVRAVANTLTAVKYRCPRGLPLDTMRRGLRAQLIRIDNALRSMALLEDRTELYASQRHLIHRIEKLYTQLQNQVLEAA